MTAYLSINGNDFFAALSRVALAAEKGNYGQPELKNITATVKNGVLHLWATDRYRVHYDALTVLSEDMAEDKIFQLPTTITSDLKRFLWNKRNQGGDAVLHFTEHQMTIGSNAGTDLLTLALPTNNLDSLRGILKLFTRTLETANSEEPDLTVNHTSLNHRFIADIDKAARAHPNHKPAGVCIEVVPNASHHVLVKMVGERTNFRALIMPIIRAKKNEDVNTVSNEESLELMSSAI